MSLFSAFLGPPLLRSTLTRKLLPPTSAAGKGGLSSQSDRRRPEGPHQIDSPRSLYKHLVRQTEKLPPEAAKFYKDSIRRGFSQHVDETDPERLRQIFSRAVEDAEWIVNKWGSKKSA